MSEAQECARCGALHTDADKHRLFHDDIAAWIELIALEIEARLRSERRQRRDEG
ncbi:MAG: hypothetical protein M3237_11330 [Actinomycetota bacterium]|nr:hypothetical protein [Actinomycetota bacterium]